MDATTENPFALTGKHALVTGAGRGIGLEIARTLKRAGAAVTVAEFDEENGRRAAEELGGRFVQVDVRDPASAERMAAEAEGVAPVDILVNNAGVAENVPAEETTDASWTNIMDVNLSGVFWCCRAVGRRMLARRGGAIVNIASMSGVVVNKPQPQAAYNVSKAGVIMLTKSLACEWADRGVRVNAVSPGYIGTEMTKLGMSNEAWYKTWLEMTPQGRVGEPRDIAHAVLYLASDAARFATGTNLIVDGGYTSW
ncbi:SDR family NAD(P)-dependent oxidoreductase [Truepera radiovictrix]|uniref:Short-chain dehydrogenase/reductase SDR n=1 Tax=Truepera radiovictrix (strain DSM 17093 / CIP 108686 / LMG 22925 / RQ-24) TaxID=649638 RepID=D7CVS6_TRURR|nr:glucose 1-dehydrogenase [Truepera radiovictrix]ADI15987.1 short-chain dehydrogenase/reductase SDR [Truepera radiovictrix DSM 17093]WMT58387.1 SDR family oxidoreductase [Truepera radiovictrix]